MHERLETGTKQVQQQVCTTPVHMDCKSVETALGDAARMQCNEDTVVLHSGCTHPTIIQVLHDLAHTMQT